MFSLLFLLFLLFFPFSFLNLLCASYLLQLRSALAHIFLTGMFSLFFAVSVPFYRQVSILLSLKQGFRLMFSWLSRMSPLGCIMGTPHLTYLLKDLCSPSLFILHSFVMSENVNSFLPVVRSETLESFLTLISYLLCLLHQQIFLPSTFKIYPEFHHPSAVAIPI